MTTPTVPPNPFPSSVLEPEVPLGRIAVRLGPWLLVLGVAFGVRLYGLRTYPLSPHEAALASDALSLLSGGDLTGAGWTQPLPVLLAAAFFFLFGPGDGAARAVSVLAGLAAIGALAWLERPIGRAAALAAAWLIALSPPLVLASTRLDGIMVGVTTGICAFAILLRPADRERRVAALTAGVTLMCLPLTHPLGWLVGSVLTAILIVRWRRVPKVLALVGTSAIVTLVLASTALLTRPQGLAAFLVTSWASLWHEFLRHPFHAWQGPLVLLLTEDIVLLVCVLLAAIRPVHTRPRWAGLVPLGIVVSAMAFGGGSIAALVLQSAALAVFAGDGLVRYLRAIPWESVRRPWDMTVLGTAFLAALIVLSLLGRVLDGPGSDVVAWAAGLASLVLLLIVTLWVLRNVWPRALVPGRTLLLLPLAAFLLLAGRNVMLVNTTTTDRPGTILHGEDSSPGLLVAIDRIRRASMDLTVFQLDPRDPTGGHGLAVVLESSVAQPFVWYLRDFPQLTVASVDRLADRAGSAQVVIVSADRHATVASARPELVWQPLPYRLTVPPVLTSPPWGTLAQGVVDPRDWRAYFSFLLYRRVAVDAPPAAVLVGLAPDVAAHAGYPAVP